MKITDCITCPKCQNPFLKSVANATFGKEYFCHKCHVYFGVNELVNQFGYDAADLSPAYPVTHAQYKGWIPKGNYPMLVNIDYAQQEERLFANLRHYSEFDNGEPYWGSVAERDEAYEVVANMYAGISEMDVYLDLLATQECALDRGVQ